MTTPTPQTAAGSAGGETLRRSPLPLVALGLGAIVGIAALLLDPRLLMVGAAILVALVVGIRYPFAAVLAYTLVAVMRPEEMGLAPIPLHLERIVAVVCIASLVLPHIARRTRIQWRWQSLDRSLIFLGIAACASVPLSVSRPWALGGCYEIAKLVFLYGIIRYTAITMPRMRAVVFWAILSTAFFSAAMALIARNLGDVYVGEYGVVRALGPTSSTGDPNSLANTLVLTVPFAILLAGTARSAPKKALYAALAAFLIYVTAFTGARGAAISLVIVVVLAAMHLRYRALAIGVIAIIAGLVWFTMPQDLQARYLTMQTYSSEYTYQSRVRNLQFGLEMLLDRPLFGYGITCYRIARVEEYDGRWIDAHNLVAQVSGETGLLGLAAFGYFLVMSFLSVRRARRALAGIDLQADPASLWLFRLCAALEIMLIGLLVQGLGSHNMLRWHFYLGAALAANCLFLARAAAERRQQADQSATPVAS